jgi:hypothetical protein
VKTSCIQLYLKTRRVPWWLQHLQNASHVRHGNVTTLSASENESERDGEEDDDDSDNDFQIVGEQSGTEDSTVDSSTGTTGSVGQKDQEGPKREGEEWVRGLV